MKAAHFFLSILLLLTTEFAVAESYSEFSSRIRSQVSDREKDGLGSMISGGIALLGGSYGWSQAEKPVEKGFYSIAQTLGLLAIGYGAETYFLRQDEEIFLQVLSSVELSAAQKDRMVTSYLKEKKQRAEEAQWIRRATLGLGGVLNLIYAQQTKDPSLKSFLYLTAGVQFVWGFSF